MVLAPRLRPKTGRGRVFHNLNSRLLINAISQLWIKLAQCFQRRSFQKLRMKNDGLKEIPIKNLSNSGDLIKIYIPDALYSIAEDIMLKRFKYLLQSLLCYCCDFVE